MTSVVNVIAFLIQVFLFIILVRVVFSFVSPFPTNAVSRFAWQVTEPVLAPIRRILPPMSGLDLSPMVAWLIGFLLIGVLRGLG